MSKLIGMLDKVEKLLFPGSLYCICCGNIIDESRTYSLCDHCMKHIRWHAGSPIEVNGTDYYFCTEYGIYERSLIFALKYDGHKYIARTLAEIMRDRLTSGDFFVSEDGENKDAGRIILVPVPIHESKERSRGFNQSILMAKHLAGLTGMDFMPRMLLRTEKTKPMKGLSPEERRRNIDGTIKLHAGYEGVASGKEILLVDDFFTTGSTAEECLKALEGAGATGISVLVFAAKTPE